jgi:hypothetical protein
VPAQRLRIANILKTLAAVGQGVFHVLHPGGPLWSFPGDVLKVIDPTEAVKAVKAIPRCFSMFVTFAQRFADGIQIGLWLRGTSVCFLRCFLPIG